MGNDTPEYLRVHTILHLGSIFFVDHVGAGTHGAYQAAIRTLRGRYQSACPVKRGGGLGLIFQLAHSRLQSGAPLDGWESAGRRAFEAFE